MTAHARTKVLQVRTYSAGDAGSVQTILHPKAVDVYFIDRLGNRSLRCVIGGTDDVEALARVGETEAVRIADGIIADALWMGRRG